MPRTFWSRVFGNRGSTPPTPPATLDVVDNADGTGAVATIGGGTVGTNTVLTQAVSEMLGGGPVLSFLPGGSRSGDGTVALALAAGYYWATAVNPTGFSNLVYLAVTMSTQSVRTRLRASIVARLAALVMDGNPNALIQDRIIENEKILSFPAMMLAYAGAAEGLEGVMTNRDDVVYQFRLRIVDRCSPDDNSKQDQYELWKEQVMRALRNQRAAGVAESVITRVQPQANQFLVTPPAWAIYTQDMLIECVCREPRGT